MAQDINSYVPVHQGPDNSTYANVNDIRVQHQHVDWWLDWNTQQLQGSIIFDFNVMSETQWIQLDTWGNTIESVTLLPANSAYDATMNGGSVPVVNNPLQWVIQNPNPYTGQVLVIMLPMIYGASAQFSVQVQYQTQAGGNYGVTFLQPFQTSDGTDPFMFTYGQSIGGRMYAPQQDTPSNRITWGGCITHDDNLSAYMAGNLTGTYQAFYGYYKSCFYNQVPTANFMMSAIVGKLERRSGQTFGGVPVFLIAEPGVIEAAATEFSALQAALNTIEVYFGTPYLWGEYTLAIMPPAFPMSGMAAPNLCYAHVSTIVGDGSQEYVIIRGGVAMWTQATVTANNWEDQWLNYGLSTYVERYVESQFYNFTFAQTNAFIGNVSMVKEHNVYGSQNQTYSSLHPVLRGSNPDDTFNIVPFEKGFQLLYYIEANVTDFASVNDFFTFYIEYNNLMSICAFQYRHTYSAFVSQYYTDDDIVNEILSAIDYEQWIYEVGAEPTGMFSFDNSATNAAIALANAFVALNGSGSPAGANAYLSWPSNQKVVFVQSLLWNTSTNSAIMTQIDNSLNITGTNDPEIKERWFALGLYVNYSPVNTPCQTFVSSTGRNKYLQPIYNACAEVGGSTYTMCVGWYNTNKTFYTPLTRALVSEILNVAF